MSEYRNAAEILPASLLAALQRYAAGQQIYVPRTEERVGWGQRSGTRQALDQRNQEIRRRRAEGVSVDELMAEYHLGYDSIRKILQGKNGSNRSRYCSGE